MDIQLNQQNIPSAKDLEEATAILTKPSKVLPTPTDNFRRVGAFFANWLEIKASPRYHPWNLFSTFVAPSEDGALTRHDFPFPFQCWMNHCQPWQPPGVDLPKMTSSLEKLAVFWNPTHLHSVYPKNGPPEKLLRHVKSRCSSIASFSTGGSKDCQVFLQMVQVPPSCWVRGSVNWGIQREGRFSFGLRWENLIDSNCVALDYFNENIWHELNLIEQIHDTGNMIE